MLELWFKANRSDNNPTTRMLTLLLFFAALNLSSSTTLGGPDTTGAPVPFMLFGRELPPTYNVARYRTTQQIAWSCWATILACTWVAIHPNLPGPFDSLWTKAKRRVITMIYALIAPEFVAIWAMRQWIAAGEIADKFNEALYTNESLKEESPSYMSVENPFKRFWLTTKSEIEESFGPPNRNAPLKWTRTHGFFIQMGGFLLCEGRRPKRVLKFPQLLKMIQEGKVDVPDYTENDLNDKGKGDFFTKLVVVSQTTWFVFQCLARWATHLPVTELEVVTLAFATLNLITYVLWWKKPQGALVAIRVPLKHPHEVDSSSSEEPEEKESWIVEALRGVVHNPWNGDSHWADGWLLGIPLRLVLCVVHPLAKMMGDNSRGGSLRVSMFSAEREPEPSDLIPLSAVGAFFGGLHIILWSYPFLTVAERWLWRSSALVITVEPLIIGIAVLVSEIFPGGSYVMLFFGLAVGVVTLFGTPLYILARLMLLALAIASLRNLPPEAYITIEWTTFLPHF